MAHLSALSPREPKVLCNYRPPKLTQNPSYTQHVSTLLFFIVCSNYKLIKGISFLITFLRVSVSGKEKNDFWLPPKAVCSAFAAKTRVRTTAVCDHAYRFIIAGFLSPSDFLRGRGSPGDQTQGLPRCRHVLYHWATSPSLLCYLSILRQGLSKLSRLALNLRSDLDFVISCSGLHHP